MEISISHGLHMGCLERAIAIAAAAHAGQVDKGGQPYILHPLRLMFALDDPTDQIVAVLHDVIEDGDIDAYGLHVGHGFSQEIVEAVEALTRRDGETYEAFITRAGANPIARRVKLADLYDNSDMTRIPNPTQKDWDRARKYARAVTALLDAEKAPPAEANGAIERSR